MDSEICKIIDDEIIPLALSNQLTLFLGAGFSLHTPTAKGTTIPGTNELIQRILKEIGIEDDAEGVPLAKAFSIGKSYIKNFDSFLIENFACGTPYSWQVNTFRYWWKKIFTTNIDTIIAKCLEVRNQSGQRYPDYKIYNYNRRMPLDQIPIEPPIVYLHGSVEHLSDGVIFDRTSYANYIVNSPDWLRIAALHILHGNCLMLGFRFEEADIEVEISKRGLWDSDKTQATKNNWIITPNISKVDVLDYESRNIKALRCTAEDFINYLSTKMEPLSPTKILKRIAPHLSISDKSVTDSAYFGSAFHHVPSMLENENQTKGIFSKFFQGDHPDWYYIANDIPAHFDYQETVLDIINDFINSKDRLSSKCFCISIIGPIASGKTTLCRSVLKQLVNVSESVYEYDVTHGVDIEKFWNAIKNTKSTLYLFFPNSHDVFFAINVIAKRANESSFIGKIIFIIEERILDWHKNKHHLSNIPPTDLREFFIKPLSTSNADSLITTLEKHGLAPQLTKNRNRSEAIKQICNKETGYRGDLLATLCDLTTGKSFSHYINEEFEDIQSEFARKLFQLLALCSAAQLPLALIYISEYFSIPIPKLVGEINDHLLGKIYMEDGSTKISIRHSSIALYYMSDWDDYPSRRDMLINLFNILSKKFTVQDIKHHPYPYKLYKSLISTNFLSEIAFKNQNGFIEDIYNACQTLFPYDGIFWLQYGNFIYKYKNNAGDAEHLFRKGLAIYDSYQLRHALGSLLLDKYCDSGCKDIESFKEGKKLLIDEINLRGTTDPYPITAYVYKLFKIKSRCSKLITDDINKELKHYLTFALKYHRTRPEIIKAVKVFYNKDKKLIQRETGFVI